MSLQAQNTTRAVTAWDGDRGHFHGQNIPLSRGLRMKLTTILILNSFARIELGKATGELRLSHALMALIVLILPGNINIFINNL